MRVSRWRYLDHEQSSDTLVVWLFFILETLRVTHRYDKNAWYHRYFKYYRGLSRLHNYHLQFEVHYSQYIESKIGQIYATVCVPNELNILFGYLRDASPIGCVFRLCFGSRVSEMGSLARTYYFALGRTFRFFTARPATSKQVYLCWNSFKLNAWTSKHSSN